MAVETGTPGGIETHHHIRPPIDRDGRSPIATMRAGVPFPSGAQRVHLAAMERDGTQTASLSVAMPGVHPGMTQKRGTWPVR